MKLFIITAATLALAGPAAAANFCTQGLNYCSRVLLSVDREFYEPQLRAQGHTGLDDWLWHCNAGGRVSVVERCQRLYGCVNGGVGQNDHCSNCIPGPWGNCRQGAQGLEGEEEQEAQEGLEDGEDQEE